MRLIDADKLKEALHEDCMTAMGTIDESTLDLLMIEIDEIPTAYDVDKVVKQLYENGCVSGSKNGFVLLNKAIPIVKGGGQGE